MLWSSTRDALVDNLLGFYLGGSLALGEFNPETEPCASPAGQLQAAEPPDKVGRVQGAEPFAGGSGLSPDLPVIWG